MPNPSQVSAQNINTELGVGTTTELSLGNNWVRNVATKSTGTISYANTRWGINFPGGLVTADYFGTNTYLRAYNTDPFLNLNATDFGFGSASANTILAIYSNGVMKFEATTTSYSVAHHVTWLTSGSNSDYTAQLLVNDAIAIGGASLNTDLVLSTTRIWSSGAAAGGGGQAINYANCDLIIKSGGELITRRVYFNTFAEVP
jgi:hypothetical protein